MEEPVRRELKNKTMSKKNNIQKSFKYTLKTKEGKILLQTIVTFGSKHQPFPDDWKENAYVQMALQDYKETFVNENFDIEISEDLDFDIQQGVKTPDI